MLTLNHVSFTYQTVKKEKKILEEISLTFPSHGFYVITGKSGFGKSTFLNLIAGILKPTSGEILYSNQKINTFSYKEQRKFLKEDISYMAEEENVLLDLSVYDNLRLMCQNNEKIFSLLKRLDLIHLKKKPVKTLSGGETKRVELAKSILKSSKILLVDEPTAGMDKEHRKEVIKLLKEESKTRLVIVATHEKEFLNASIDGHIFLEGNGKVEEISKSETLENDNKNSKKEKGKTSIILKLPFIHLKKFKIKTLFSMIIFFCAFSLFLLTSLLNKFDVETLEKQALLKEKNNFLFINSTASSSFSKEEVASLQEEIPSLQIGRYYYQESSPLTLTKSVIQEEIPAYYEYGNNPILFYEYNENSFTKDQEIIGTYPKEKNEGMISSYLADYIFYITNKPVSYESLLNQTIFFGKIPVTISGIFLENTEKYQPLKTLLTKDITEDNQNLYDDFLYTIIPMGLNCYVTDEFNLYASTFSENLDSIKIVELNGMIIDSPVIVLKKSIETSKGIITELKENEIIISESLQKMLETHNVTTSKLTLQKENLEKTVTVVGTSLDNAIYINESTYQFFINQFYEANQLYFYIDNNNVDKALELFPTFNNTYTRKTAYTTRLLAKEEEIEKIIPVLIFFKIVFTILTVLILVNYLMNSITANQKEIKTISKNGISLLWSALSYFLEFFLLTSIPLLCAIGVTRQIQILWNNKLTRQMFFFFEPLNWNLKSTVFAFVILLGLSWVFIIGVLSLKRTEKSKKSHKM